MAEDATTRMFKADTTCRDFVMDSALENVSVAGWLRPIWSELPSEGKKYHVNAKYRALTSTREELLSLVGTSLVGSDAWDALSYQDASGMGERAREVMRTGGEHVAPDDALTSDERYARVAKFIQAQARGSAIRLLRRLPSDEMLASDRQLFRDEIAKDEYESVGEALVALAAGAESRDQHLVLEALSRAAIVSSTKSEVLQTLLQDAGRALLVVLTGEDDVVIASAAARALAGSSSCSAAQLIEMMYSNKADVRIEAVRAFCDRSSRADIEGMLKEYPRRETFHFYNVTSYMDRFLYSAGASDESSQTEIRS